MANKKTKREMGTLVQIEAEINFPEGKKKVQFVKKERFEIKDCEEGKFICLRLINGESFFGFFKGIDDELVRMCSISGKHTCLTNIELVSDYFEEEPQNN